MTFEVPVYAVWGNHEDHHVVTELHDGRLSVPNLRLLHEKAEYHIGRLHVFGLGGNLLPGSKLFHQPVAGGGGRVWSTLYQYMELMDLVTERRGKDEVRILVSHVSPGKEALISLIGIHTRANLILSGHMGQPFCMAWNDSSVMEPEASEHRISNLLAEVRGLLEEVDTDRRPEVTTFMERLETLPKESIPGGRREPVPRWYSEMYNLNLPDADVGCAVLEIDGHSLRISTYSTGIKV